MEEVEATLFDGDTVILSGITVLLDFADAPGGSPEAPGWHAHAALPLGVIVEPGEQMRIETADGRSGPVAILGSPTIEGDRALHVFAGIGPLTRSGG
jgi:hypothetical protein